MAHQNNTSLYSRLADRLNQFPQRAPLSDSLYEILRILFTEREAGLVAQLPIKPFTADKAASIWKTDLTSARTILDTLASRAILLDIEQHAEQYYCLPPPMAGFFEFALMRVREDIDQKALSELFYQYLNVEEDFVRDLFADTTTPLGRIFVQEGVLNPQQSLEVLDYEKASHIIRTASHIGISMCYCRHKKSHLNMACDAPMDICMTFNTSASSLIKHGHARQVDVAACLDLLHEAQDYNLVQFGENNQEGVNFICNCCSCCCDALQTMQNFAIAQTIHSNFVAHMGEGCVGCGKCVKVCPMKTITMQIKDNAAPHALLDAERCIGCGVCIRSCPTQTLQLKGRAQRSITPVNTMHRVVMLATERGMLKELLQDNSALLSYRILGALIGSVAKQPGFLRDSAVKQLKSRYMERIMRNLDK